MQHLSEDELRSLLNEAGAKVSVGSRYLHYKGNSYLVTGVCIIEATDGVGVLYRADNPGLEEISFLRPLEEFIETVEFDGKMTERFKKI
jgi:hypothetical protein